MANTYSKLYVHVVFAVKVRESLISGSWREKLYKYICGIVNNNQQKVYAINGVQNHIHILFSFKPNILLSDLIRDIKANSTRWINENKFVKGIFHCKRASEHFQFRNQWLIKR
jgi:REP element-mobilizing transposase RayT